MIWEYINRDEIPEHGDFCFFVTHFGKSYYVVGKSRLPHTVERKIMFRIRMIAN